MSRIRTALIASAAVLGVAGLAAPSGSAEARTFVSVGVGLPLIAPAPVYGPAPVYYPPAPVYGAPYYPAYAPYPAYGYAPAVGVGIGWTWWGGRWHHR
jgi:hypothetical protein